jgi:hypothetical protein
MASASPYLKSEILKSSTDDSTLPVAIKLDMKFNIVKSIIDFIYLENAIIPKIHLEEFFRCCQLLQIEGLQDPAAAIKKEPIASTSKVSDESYDNKPELEDESETTEESEMKPPPQKKIKTESGVPANPPPRFAKQPDGKIVCLSCTKSFGFLQNAKRHHKLTHTVSTEIFECMYCHKEFNFKYLLNQHLIMAHKITQAMLKNPIP